MRWMGLDHGTKNIGIAFSDEMEIIASPFEVWSNNGMQTINKLYKLAIKEEVQGLVVGLPLHKDNTKSSTANLAIKFGESLRVITGGLPLVFWNEHLTSVEAHSLLAKYKSKKNKRNKISLDSVAAAIILQEFLEKRSKKSNL